jgi:hypothetical protein
LDGGLLKRLDLLQITVRPSKATATCVGADEPLRKVNAGRAWYFDTDAGKRYGMMGRRRVACVAHHEKA